MEKTLNHINSKKKKIQSPLNIKHAQYIHQTVGNQNDITCNPEKTQ